MTSPQSGQSRQAIDSTTARTAAVFDQIERAIGDLKSLATPQADANVIGRDTHEVRALLDRNFGYLCQLAQLMGVTWTPTRSDQAA